MDSMEATVVVKYIGEEIIGTYRRMKSLSFPSCYMQDKVWESVRPASIHFGYNSIMVYIPGNQKVTVEIDRESDALVIRPAAFLK